MSFVMKEYVSLDPMNISFFSFVAVMPRPNRLADLIEQFWFRRKFRCIGRGAAIESISVAQAYFVALHVVSSRSQRRLGFNWTRSPFTEIIFSNQGLSITVISR